MTNGEKIQTILDIDKDCTEVYGKNGMMTFSVPQDWWNAEYKEPTTAVWSYYDQNDVTQNKWHDVQTCSKCGMGGKHYDEFRYCPNCGRIMTNAKGWGNRWK